MAQKRFSDSEAMVRALTPSYPVYCLHPETLRARAAWFVDRFPGRVLYAVKCNPNPAVVRYLHEGGVTHFDTASLTEIAQVREQLPEASLYFMHPVKGRAVIRNAFRVYDVRHFVADHPDEIAKIIKETRGDDLAIVIRMATPPAGAALDLSAKFGARPAEAVEMLKMVHAAGAEPGLCFHVGSQCTQPQAYRTALDLVAGVLDAADVPLKYLDVGGGFPAAYEGQEALPLEDFIAAIEEGLASLDLPEDCALMCEPGRAMVADACSLVVQVQLRKDDRLYLNDGIYGSFNETVSMRLRPPVRLIRPDGEVAETETEFAGFGPTCDSTDRLPFPLRLPADTREGDWIEIGLMGAYTNAGASHFNGFYPETYVTVEKRSIYG